MNIYKNYYRNLVQENRQILYSLLLPDAEDKEFNSILVSKLKGKGSPAETLSEDRDFLSILLNEIIQEHKDDSPEIRRFKSLFEESLVSTEDSDLEFFFWFLGDMDDHISALEGHEKEFQKSSKSRKKGKKRSRKRSARKTKALKAKNERSKGNQ